MKKSIFSLVLLCLFSITTINQLKAQDYCGFDHLLDEISADSISNDIFDSVRTNIHNQVVLNANTSTFIVQPNNYVIPVVFHVVGNETSGAGTITDTQILDQLQLLNDGFADLLGSTLPIADDAQIKFCLAQNTPSGAPWSDYNDSSLPTTAGITRHTSSSANTLSNNHNMDQFGPNGQQDLTNLAYFNPNRYLNIWIVNNIAYSSGGANVVLGYSPFPVAPSLAYLDGIVMREDAFGINSSHPNYNQGRTLIHEAGHYLGLFHTFQGGCNEITFTTPCDAVGSGDECCDTPPVSTANQDDCTNLVGANSCFEFALDEPDMIENHMDYAYDNINTCRNTFTDDQANRMHATIQLYRSVLVSYSNLLLTGVQCLPPGLNPEFVTNQPNGSTQFCTGDPYGFIAAPGAATYSWNFSGGSPVTSSIQNPTGIVWSTPGVYTVTLTVTDGLGGSASSTLQVFVCECNPLDPLNNANAHWYFGSNCALDFTTGMAVPTTPSSIGTSVIETSACVSDNSGNLVIYTDGRDVWDDGHALVNTTNLNGSPNSIFISNAKGSVIVPRPGSNNYYVFASSDVPQSGISNGISMYEYETLTNTMVSTTPIHPTENYVTTEPIVAIPHCNGTDYWVVVKPTTNDPGNLYTLTNPGPVPNVNEFIASYLVTSSGISGSPVLSSSGPYIPPTSYPGNNVWIGHISVSPDKKMIAFTDITDNNCYLYYFNSGNGKCEYLTTLSINTPLGISFSPNSEILYAEVGYPHSIRQYDLSNISPCNPNPPSVDFNYLPSSGVSMAPSIFNTLQLGPDNRLYISHNGAPSNPQQELSVINFPDNINLSGTSNDCGYNYHGVQLLTGQFSDSGLPNDIDGFIGSNTPEFSYCGSNCGDFCFTNLGCGTNFKWDFGDGNTISGVNGPIPAGTNGGLTTGNYEYPCHQYSPGTYTITLTIDAQPPVSHTITIVPPPAPTITGPNPVCSTSTLPNTYTGPTGYDYQWNITNGTPVGGVNGQSVDVVWNTFPATLELIITDPLTGCSNSTTITITEISTLPSVNAGLDQVFCPTEPPVQLNALVANASSVIWTPATGLSCTSCLDPFASPLSSTVYTLSATNACGTTTDDVQVTVSCCTNCNLLPTTGTVLSTNPTAGQTYCSSDLTINGNITITNCEIKMDPNATITVPSGSTLNLRGVHIYSCADMWNGIVVQPGGKVNIDGFFSFSFPPPQVVLKSSMIEDARIAVNVLGSTLTTNILSVQNTIFNRNYIAIAISGYNQNIANYPFHIEDCIFTCRDLPFTQNSLVWPNVGSLQVPNSVGPLEAPYLNSSLYSETNSAAYLKSPFGPFTKSYAGIFMRSVGDVVSPETSSPTWYEVEIGDIGTNNFNLFDNLQYGIYSISSNFTCINGVFQKTVGATKEDFGTAIYGLAVGNSNNRARVIPGNNSGNYNNLFYDCHRAIYTENYFENDFSECEFRSTQVLTSYIPPIHRGSNGIFVKSNRYRDMNASDNLFYNIENAIVFIGDHGPYDIGGVFTASDGQYSGQINVDRNEIDAFFQSTTPTEYTRNAITITNVVPIVTPIHIVPTTTITASSNEITDVHRGILWRNWHKRHLYSNSNNIRLDSDPYSAFATQFGIAIVNCESTEWVQFNDILGNGNFSNPNVKGIWSASSNGLNVTCNTTKATTHGIEFAGSAFFNTFRKNTMENNVNGYVLNFNGVIGTQGGPGDPSDNRWLGTWTPPFEFKTATFFSSSQNSVLYIRNSPPVYNPDGSTLTNLTIGSDDYLISNGSLQPTTTNLPFILGCPVTQAPVPIQQPEIIHLEKIAQDSMDFGINDAETKYIYKNKLYRALENNPAIMSNSPILQNFYANAQNSRYEDFRTIESDINDGNVSDALNHSNSLQTVNPIEDNYKLFYEKYLKYQTDTILPSDSLAIIEIAQKCPYTDGDVVYYARALYNSVYNSNVFFEDNCEIAEGNKSMGINESENGLDVELYPNPGKDIFYLKLSNNSNEAVIEIMDLGGKIVYQTNLYAENSVFELKPELSRGVYVVKITDPVTGLGTVKRLVVQ